MLVYLVSLDYGSGISGISLFFIPLYFLFLCSMYVITLIISTVNR